MVYSTYLWWFGGVVYYCFNHMIGIQMMQDLKLLTMLRLWMVTSWSRRAAPWVLVHNLVSNVTCTMQIIAEVAKNPWIADKPQNTMIYCLIYDNIYIYMIF